MWISDPDEICEICQNFYNLSIEAAFEKKTLKLTLKLKVDSPTACAIHRMSIVHSQVTPGTTCRQPRQL